MTKLAIFLFAIALQAACTPPEQWDPTPPYAEWTDQAKPGQEEATRIVWEKVFGNASGEDLQVYWVEGDGLTCGPYGLVTSFEYDEGCFSGLAFHTKGVVWVAWSKYHQKFSDTAFAHELCHIHSYYNLDDDGDGDHNGPCFEDDGLAYRANEALRLVDL